MDLKVPFAVTGHIYVIGWGYIFRRDIRGLKHFLHS